MNLSRLITDDLFSHFLEAGNDTFMVIKESPYANIADDISSPYPEGMIIFVRTSPYALLASYALFVSENSQTLQTVEEVKLNENKIIHASTDKSVVVVVQCLPLLEGRPEETTKQALIEKLRDSYKLHCRLRESIERSKESFIEARKQERQK